MIGIGSFKIQKIVVVWILLTLPLSLHDERSRARSKRSFFMVHKCLLEASGWFSVDDMQQISPCQYCEPQINESERDSSRQPRWTNKDCTLTEHWARKWIRTNHDDLRHINSGQWKIWKIDLDCWLLSTSKTGFPIMDRLVSSLGRLDLALTPF